MQNLEEKERKLHQTRSNFRTRNSGHDGKHLPECFSNSVPPGRTDNYRNAVPAPKCLLERRSGAFRHHYTTVLTYSHSLHCAELFEVWKYNDSNERNTSTCIGRLLTSRVCFESIQLHQNVMHPLIYCVLTWIMSICHFIFIYLVWFICCSVIMRFIKNLLVNTRDSSCC